jgi:arabinogalactan oligomer / maltooligosaccharide transport system substrate-binding protein
MKKIVVLMLLLFVLVGCGRRPSSSTSEDITLTIWEDSKNIELVSLLTEEFARFYAFNYPNAPKLKFEFVPHSEQSAIEDLVLAGPAGTGPDILAFVHDTLDTAVTGNLLARNSFSDKIKATHSPEAVQAASLNQVMYGFPITSESQIIIYRKSKINSTQIQSIEGIINSDQANAKLVWDIFEGYYSFGLLNDALLYGLDGETTSGIKSSYLNFATPQAVQNVSYARNTYRNHPNLVIPGSTSGSTDIEGLSLFLSGDVDAIIVAPYFWASAKQHFGNDVGMAALPSINGQVMRPFSGYKLYGVSRYSKHPALAQQLADFLTSEWAQSIRLRDKSLLPTVTSLTNQLNQTSIQVDSWRALATTRVTVPESVLIEARIFKTSLDQSITMPKIARFAAFWIAYANNMKALWEQTSLTEAQLIEYLNNITQNM